MVSISKHPKLDNVYWASIEGKGKKLVTKNLVPGSKAFVDEWLIEKDGSEFRVWDPYRSKLAAAILKDMKGIPIREGSRVLYLGAASGTTASFVSDMVGQKGKVYCVEVSSRPLRDLLQVCSKRPNMLPILADARHPESYAPLVSEVDVVYQDIAQPDQVAIFIKNTQIFLREGGHGVLAVKARAIDVTKEPREIFQSELENLRREFEVLDVKVLEPYERDHAMFIVLSTAGQKL